MMLRVYPSEMPNFLIVRVNLCSLVYDIFSSSVPEILSTHSFFKDNLSIVSFAEAVVLDTFLQVLPFLPTCTWVHSWWEFPGLC